MSVSYVEPSAGPREVGRATVAPPRLAVVATSGVISAGGELMLADLMRYRPAGAEWLVALLEDGPLAGVLRETGVSVEVLPAGRVRHAHRYTATVIRLARLARRHDVSVLVGWGPKAQLYAGPAGMLTRRPVVWYQLGWPAADDAFSRLTAALPARGVVGVSRASAEAQSRIWPRRAVAAVPPGVDLERFDPTALPSPAAARAQLGLPPERILLGSFARLQSWKGIHFLLESLPALIAAGVDAHCVVVGAPHPLEPEYAVRLRELASELGIGDRVTFAGFRREPELWMQATDVVVHASYGEPFGKVVVEAMAMGKPVVATRAGGPSETIRDGVDGVLVDGGDVSALTRGLLAVIRDPAGGRRLGEAARSRAAEFSAQAYALRFTRAALDLAAIDAGELVVAPGPGGRPG